MQGADPGGPAPDLGGGLLGGHVERGVPPTRDARRASEQQRRLADAGLAADQGDRAGDESAREDPVELGDSRRCGRDVVGGHLADAAGGFAVGSHRTTVGASRSSTRVFHSSQPGQRPAHTGVAAPQSCTVHRARLGLLAGSGRGHVRHEPIVPGGGVRNSGPSGNAATPRSGWRGRAPRRSRTPRRRPARPGAPIGGSWRGRELDRFSFEHRRPPDRAVRGLWWARRVDVAGQSHRHLDLQDLVDVPADALLDEIERIGLECLGQFGVVGQR